ncbi:bacillithiol biosynthesis cysteine-adding enzyme BshC [Chryseobacterium koreense]|uniref:bacillithiol biosynthesis cysteine-adding enzyme BshC n=1 Tax=Chryseobacterium koreense TaxID=232216 RepID=UPI0026ED96C3|nr:bacillithiol biosynthesis cysteine-adding enzyme BshC [Chryseobacterium koreense]
MKKLTNIPFTAIESVPQLIKDFLNSEIPGFEQTVFNLQNVEKQFVLKEENFSSDHRKMLSRVLQKQHSDLSLSPKQKENLEFLAKENAFTVTTGHQLNLFTGPVFFIYKILQTIKLAEFLNQNFPDRKVVPVFWMATEDHDFEEINHFQTENGYYETKAKSGGVVGKIRLEDDFFISEFEKEFKDSVFGTELILMMKRAYKKGRTLTESTKLLVHQLFSEYGLILIDGDDALLKEEMRDLFRNELLHQELQNATKETVDFLTEKYGRVQVNPREINLFYLTETRNRIEFKKDHFQVVDTELSFSKDEILNELENFPERFSPNALMRPVFQETVLPNLAYIGGNAEIMYWLELRDYFKKINLPFPVLIPRNAMLFVSEKTLTKTKSLGLEIEDWFRNFASVSKSILLNDNEMAHLLDQEEKSLIDQFDHISAKAELTDKTFGNLVNAEKARQLKSFARMRKRLLRAEKIKQHEKLERLEHLFLKVHPGKIWQERVYNFSVFYSEFGKEWLRNCFEAMDAENSQLIIFSL